MTLENKPVRDMTILDPNFLIQEYGSKIYSLLPLKKFLQTKSIFSFLTNAAMEPVFLQDLAESQTQLIMPNELEFVYLNHNLPVSDLNSEIVQQFNIIKLLQDAQQMSSKDKRTTSDMDSDKIMTHYTKEGKPQNNDLKVLSNTIFSINYNESSKEKFVTTVSSAERSQKTDYLVQDNTSDHIITINTESIMRYLPLSLNLPPTVNLHVGAYGEKVTDSYKADAVTLGKEIFFAKDKLDLTTQTGVALLVHEFTHVHQNQNLQSQLPTTSSDLGFEEEALANERSALSTFENPNRISFVDNSMVYPHHNSFVLNNMETNPMSLNFATTSLSQNRNPHNESVLENHSNLFFSKNSYGQNYSNVTFRDAITVYESKPSLTYMLPTTFHSESVSTNTRTGNIRNLTPRTAQIDRSSGASSAAAQPVSPTPTGDSINIEMLTNQVYEKITQKIKLERDRVGYR